MNWLDRITIARKVALGVAGVIALSLLLGGVALLTVKQINSHLRDVADEQLPETNALATMNEALATVSRGQNALLLPNLPPDLYKSATSRLDKALARIEEARQQFDALPHEEAAAKAWAAVQQPYQTWRTQVRGVADAALEWDRVRTARGAAEAGPSYERAWAAWMSARHAYAPLEQALASAGKDLAARGARARDGGHAAARRAVIVIAAFLVAALAIAAAAGLVLTRSIQRSIDHLLRETGTLAKAVQAGALDVRGNVADVSAEFRPVVEGMNGTMDAFVAPVRITADHLARIARGEVPPKITAEFRGDFNEMKSSLNTCVDAVNALVADANGLATAAVDGKLSTRADAARHEGDFRKIVAGVNAALDAVLAPIGEAAQALEKLAQRDLRARMEGDYRGDHAKMKDCLNATATALLESMSQVAETVGQVSSAATQIASSSQAVADGASRQASSLEETSSALESMSSMTKQSSDNAQQANGLAQTARRAAAEGSEAMERMTGAMTKIRASAEGTSQIIKDINEIAFQTNLLALNAAVEAARAGEAGRGFAVVAEEVRSLALRSKEAANRTEALIRESVKQAGEGEVTAGHVHAKLGEIAGSVGKVTDIVAEIAASAKEQAVGIEQITKAVAEIDKVTQQNAANSEESSSAASELSGQSERLAAMVTTFQLDGSVSELPAAPAIDVAHLARADGTRGAARA